MPRVWVTFKMEAPARTGVAFRLRISVRVSYFQGSG